MARPYWKGAISFGLVNVPVSLYPAIRKRDFTFHLYHDADGGRIREKRVCERDGKEVPWNHVVKGYEISKNQVVTLTQEELRAADPERDRAIGIEEFVKLEEVESLQIDRSYYVAPEGRSAKAYALLAEALERTGQVAIARIVLSTKQHLCVVRSAESRMVLTTLVWADEVLEAPEVPRTTVGGKELQMAERLVQSMSGKFAPSRFKDDHRARVEALIRKKAKGQPIETPPASQPSRVVDLARALEQSLLAASKAPARRSARARPARARRRAAPARARARRR
ncbi:MAG: Ku protein [Myxococcaceae bacterium]|nr:MAG: Ku protein [Myxococcaceae bacterium]